MRRYLHTEWGGRSWVLEVDELGPGTKCDDEHGHCSLLSLRGLAATRDDLKTRCLPRRRLVGVEQYRSRIQATFAPADWGGLIVRAAWSPSCGGVGGRSGRSRLARLRSGCSITWKRSCKAGGERSGHAREGGGQRAPRGAARSSFGGPQLRRPGIGVRFGQPGHPCRHAILRDSTPLRSRAPTKV